MKQLTVPENYLFGQIKFKLTDEEFKEESNLMFKIQENVLNRLLGEKPSTNLNYKRDILLEDGTILKGAWCICLEKDTNTGTYQYDRRITVEFKGE